MLCSPNSVTNLIWHMSKSHSFLQASNLLLEKKFIVIRNFNYSDTTAITFRLNCCKLGAALPLFTCPHLRLKNEPNFRHIARWLLMSPCPVTT